MRIILRALAVVALLLVAALLTALVTARFRDGPFGPFPGGPLERGPLIRGEFLDAETIASVKEVELQLRAPPRSRLTWIVEYGGGLYIPCGFVGVPLLKRWPHQAVEDGRSTLRVLGRRYEGRLLRVREKPLYRATRAKLIEKYGGVFSADPEDLWIFHFEPAVSPESGEVPASPDPRRGGSEPSDAP